MGENLEEGEIEPGAMTPVEKSTPDALGLKIIKNLVGQEPLQ